MLFLVDLHMHNNRLTISFENFGATCVLCVGGGGECTLYVGFLNVTSFFFPSKRHRHQHKKMCVTSPFQDRPACMARRCAIHAHGVSERRTDKRTVWSLLLITGVTTTALLVTWPPLWQEAEREGSKHGREIKNMGSLSRILQDRFRFLEMVHHYVKAGKVKQGIRGSIWLPEACIQSIMGIILLVCCWR